MTASVEAGKYLTNLNDFLIKIFIKLGMEKYFLTWKITPKINIQLKLYLRGDTECYAHKIWNEARIFTLNASQCCIGYHTQYDKVI